MTGTDRGVVLAAVELPDYITQDINTALSWIAGIAAVVCIAKIIFVGGRMAWDHKHTPGLESPTAAEFLAAVFGWILASGAAVTMAVVLIEAGRTPENSAPAPDKPPSLVTDIQQKFPPLEEEK
ncbi:hypothetical protein [Rhodococcus opacus]|uniref:hypothetical protein n=1 Tax=Rhodococcus opacus TaxID=37919 RepID=UPI001F574AA8|nr:hypothetical protein [Rhodococcus opacus]UNN05243.1 hypothetical protein MOO23_40205 [Rhodococcus opacus]